MNIGVIRFFRGICTYPARNKANLIRKKCEYIAERFMKEVNPMVAKWNELKRAKKASAPSPAAYPRQLLLPSLSYG